MTRISNIEIRVILLVGRLVIRVRLRFLGIILLVARLVIRVRLRFLGIILLIGGQRFV